MHVNLAQLQHGPQQVHCLLGVNMGKVKGLNDLVFVLFGFLPTLRVDDDRLTVQDFLAQAVHLHDQFHRLGEAGFLQEDRNRLAVDILIKDEVDTT